MKNALILHGTGNDSQRNWFPWLRQELEKKNWKVWVPDLPQANKPNIKVDTCILVGTFNNNLDRDDLNDLFLKPFDFEKIKTKAKKFIFIHSDNDPYCPIEHAKFQSKKLNGKLIIKKAQKHFSISTAGEKYKKFPFLLKLIINN